MIGGSRLGASFVVLVIGVLDDLRHARTEKRSAYIGVAALVATTVIYVPALGLGYLGLRNGLFDGLRLEGRDLASVVDAVYGPLTGLATAHPAPLRALRGRRRVPARGLQAHRPLLPDLHARESPVSLAGRVVYRPWSMFAIGLAVTAVTLSVSISLSLLVPLAAKGYVRRENVCPYILGANITTFIDTLFAGALVGHPDAVRIVAVLMACVTPSPCPSSSSFPTPSSGSWTAWRRRATRSTRSLVAFVVVLLLVPRS